MTEFIILFPAPENARPKWSFRVPVCSGPRVYDRFENGGVDAGRTLFLTIIKALEKRGD